MTTTRLHSLALFALALACVGGNVNAQTHDVTSTLHNLSVGGTGTIGSTESEVCVFCHTPHAASQQQTPLWNRSLSSPYVPYESPSANAVPGQPTGDSKLCLSCHDGTIALGNVLNLRGAPATITMTGTNPDGTIPAGRTLLGTSLLNDHPISFSFDGSLSTVDGELVNPTTLTGGVRLWEGSTPGVADEVQCSTCHDAHEAAEPKFLRKGLMGQSDNLCLTCHTKTGWAGSSHESSAEAWPAGQSVEEVRDHSCAACHSPHTDAGAERLLRDGTSGGQSAIEQTCFQCHISSALDGIAHDIEAQFRKSSVHPVTLNPGGHRPVFLSSTPLPENVELDPGSPAGSSGYIDEKHVECVDCHNPHRVTPSNRTEGMPGISIDGSPVANVVNDPNPNDGQASDVQYPICLRCHGDTYDTAIGTAPLASGAIPSNKRLEFQTTNSSFHPVAGPGRNRSSRLNSQLTGQNLSINSVIKCTDCHNNDAYENTTGRVTSSGTTDDPVGPHGSAYDSILRAPFWGQLPGPSDWNANNFKLCFRCHSSSRLMGSQSEFDDQVEGRDNLHEVHLDDRSDKARATCKSCHYNIHSNVEAQNTQYRIDGTIYMSPPDFISTRLINFHPNIRPIGGRARPEWWYDTDSQERRCYLQCHRENGTPGGEVMNGDPYGP